MKRIAALAATLALLAGCGGSDEGPCIPGTERTTYIPITHMIGKVPYTQLVPVTSCDHYPKEDS